MDGLPPELVVHTFTFLQPKEVLRSVCLVCSQWNVLCNNGLLWQAFCVQAAIQGDQDWKALFKTRKLQLEWDPTNMGPRVSLAEKNRLAIMNGEGWGGGGVICTRGFSSGVHYWECEVVEWTTAMLGVALPTTRLARMSNVYLEGTMAVAFCRNGLVFGSATIAFTDWDRKEDTFVMGMQLAFTPLVHDGEEERKGAALTYFMGGKRVLEVALSPLLARARKDGVAEKDIKLYPVGELGRTPVQLRLLKYEKRD